VPSSGASPQHIAGRYTCCRLLRPIYFWNIYMQYLQHTSEDKWNTQNIYCKCVYLDVASILSGCCVCFYNSFEMFFCKCFICMCLCVSFVLGRMLEVLHLDVLKVDWALHLPPRLLLPHLGISSSSWRQLGIRTRGAGRCHPSSSSHTSDVWAARPPRVAREMECRHGRPFVRLDASTVKVSIT
jgi:hypothetical protein